MQLEFYYGPLDGHCCDFPPKRVPAKVQFCLSGGKGWSPFFCVYDYQPKQKRFVYSQWSLTDPQVVVRDDCVARPYLELSGEGRLYSVWRSVTDLKGEQ